MKKVDYRFNIDPYTLINMLDSQKLLKQSYSSIDNQQNKVIETTEMTVDNTFEYDVKRNGNLAYQLLKQSKANRQSNQTKFQ